MAFNIVLADDHPSVLMGTKVYLEQEGFHIGDTFTNGIEAYHCIVAKAHDLAILDINMPGMNGIEIAAALQKAKVKTKLIFMTFHNESSVINRAKELGVKGYLLKDEGMDEVVNCIREVAKGKEYYSKSLKEKMRISEEIDGQQATHGLTFAELKIVSLIAQQKSSKDIASQLFVTEKTIETHRRNIIRKLNIPATRNALLIWAMKNIDPM